MICSGGKSFLGPPPDKSSTGELRILPPLFLGMRKVDSKQRGIVSRAFVEIRVLVVVCYKTAILLLHVLAHMKGRPLLIHIQMPRNTSDSEPHASGGDGDDNTFCETFQRPLPLPSYRFYPDILYTRSLLLSRLLSHRHPPVCPHRLSPWWEHRAS